MSKNPVPHLLVVEDDAHDFELIESSLRDGGLDFTATCIDDVGGLAREIERHRPDIVLCDHASARWDSFAVLRAVRAREPEMPFIVVTGAISDETLERLLGGGADDCVLKGRLEALYPVVRGAIRTGHERLRVRALEEECRQLRRELDAALARRGLQQALPICAGCRQILDGAKGTINLEAYLRDRYAIRFSHGLCPECIKRYVSELK